MMNCAPFFIGFDEMYVVNYLHGSVGKCGNIELCARVFARSAVGYCDLYNIFSNAASHGHDSLCIWIIDRLKSIAAATRDDSLLTSLRYCAQYAILCAAAADQWSTCLMLRARFPNCFHNRAIDEVTFASICRSSPHLASCVFGWFIEDGADLDRFLSDTSIKGIVIDGLRARYRALRDAK